MSETNADISAEERAQMFHESYDSGFDAGTTLADLVIAAGDFLTRIIGADTVDAGMARIVEPVVTTSGTPMDSPSDWRHALKEASSNCFSEWPLGARLHDLTAYAVYGIVLDGSEDAEERAQHLEELVTEAEVFAAQAPLTAWGLATPASSHLLRLVRLASNRWALDTGRPVEPAALAEFGGVSEGRIRNMMSGTNRAFTAQDGRIPAVEALAWLATRKKEFWTSIWREQPLPQYEDRNRPPLEEALFVPVARDGSVFHPGLQRGAGYTIGPKGKERQIADFAEALAKLQSMPVPYWRRPNTQGNWGIVSGISWDRYDATDLAMLAAQPLPIAADTSRA
ncbi:hypothetical protein ABNQ38_33810 (plasmid) [Azospirillum sp. A29]|uniref:hypothetical protein n=1 Tax=Azospirillum sp. A29 TaxID=3160606 RepID=UPI0036716894